MRPSRLNYLLILVWGCAQLVCAQTTDPVKVAALQEKFQHGLDLEQQGKVAEALPIYQEILAEEPKARASLLHAGMICQHLNQLDQANDYLLRLHQLEPKYPAALEALIQINQTQGHAPRVVSLLKEFKELHDRGDVPAFSSSLYFVRERVNLPDGNQAVFCEFFDYAMEPNTAWMMQEFDSQKSLTHWILLNYDPGDTQKVRAKDPVKFARVEVFLLQEDVIQDNRIKAIQVYQQIFSLPPYEKVRAAMLTLLKTPPEPMHTEQADVPVPDFDKDASTELAGKTRVESITPPPPISKPAPVPVQETVPGH